MKLVIGFSRPKNKIFPVFSWLIRLFDRTAYSHVYVRWYSDNVDVDVVYEASGSAVKFVGKTIFDNRVYPVHEYAVDIDQYTYKKLLKFCMTYAGTNYGMKQVLGIVLVRLLNLDKNPLSSGRKSQVCSELVGYIIEDILNEEIDIDLDIAGPRDIKEFLDKKTIFFNRLF